jgi:hypothetical protein
MKDHKLIYVLSTLKATKILVAEIQPYISRLYDLDITHFMEIEDLCEDCKNYYMAGLPVSQDLVKILLIRIKKCHEILRQLYDTVRKNAGDTGKLLYYRDNLLICLTNLKRRSAGFKYEEKRVYLVSETDQVKEVVGKNDEDVDKKNSANVVMSAEAIKAQRMEFENQEMGWDHPDAWDYVPNEIEYDETYP